MKQDCQLKTAAVVSMDFPYQAYSLLLTVYSAFLILAAIKSTKAGTFLYPQLLNLVQLLTRLADKEFSHEEFLN